MWLLDTTSLELVDIVNTSNIKYAILSHMWEDEEVSFAELHEHRSFAEGKKGFAKINSCCQIAKIALGLDYAWIDTCCIDKRSSAELSEAINSMYKWYQEAYVCLVYLRDVGPPREGEDGRSQQLEELQSSRWFTRGWTLQELLAPPNLIYLAADWSVVGGTGRSPRDRGYKYIATSVAEAAGIPEDALVSYTRPPQRCIAQVMSWAAGRQTTRGEDMAYSLMGLFNVNMPILYGEGATKAFHRLQQELLSISSDQSILAWARVEISKSAGFSFLADSPLDFLLAQTPGIPATVQQRTESLEPHAMTNIGLSISMRLDPDFELEDRTSWVLESTSEPVVAELQCSLWKGGKSVCLAILLEPILGANVSINGVPRQAFQRIARHWLIQVPEHHFDGRPYEQVIILRDELVFKAQILASDAREELERKVGYHKSPSTKDKLKNIVHRFR